MSLDVYLTVKEAVPARPPGSGIFIREAGTNREITREEWDTRFPDREPVVFTGEPDSCEVYSGNITHNLNRMAEAAGIYKHLWRHEELGIVHASELVEPLAAGLARLQADPEKFRAFNPVNGWGDYEGLVAFVTDYLQACRDYPEAEVTAWR